MIAASERALAQPPDFGKTWPATMPQQARRRWSARKKTDFVWQFAGSASPYCPATNVEGHPNFQIEGPTGQKQACSLPALSIDDVLASHSSRASADGSTGLADSGSCHAHTVNSCPADTAGSGDLGDHAVRRRNNRRGCHGLCRYGNE